MISTEDSEWLTPEDAIMILYVVVISAVCGILCKKFTCLFVLLGSSSCLIKLGCCPIIKLGYNVVLSLHWTLLS